MDFESRGRFEADDSVRELPKENILEETPIPEDNKFYAFLEEQGHKVDRNDAGSVAQALQELRKTDAYEAAPLGIEDFEKSLQKTETVEQANEQLVAPERLEEIAVWLRSRGTEFANVNANEPRSIVEAFNLQKAIEVKDKAFVGNYGEVDNFSDAPVRMEDDIRKLEEAL